MKRGQSLKIHNKNCDGDIFQFADDSFQLLTTSKNVVTSYLADFQFPPKRKRDENLYNQGLLHRLFT